MTYDKVKQIGDEFRKKYPSLSTDLRFGRALNIIRRDGVRPMGDGKYLVIGDKDKCYLVTVGKSPTCMVDGTDEPCPDHAKGNICKHRRAVGMVMLTMK
ncbi:MAG TPA: hypothetical protein PKD55_01290 [Bellilinea sp.]|nr:hypothetical protein [Bellilinea sp.]